MKTGRSDLGSVLDVEMDHPCELGVNPPRRSRVAGSALLWLWLHLIAGASQAPAGFVGPSHAIGSLIDRGVYGEAERQARSLHDDVEAQFGADSLELARASDLLVDVLVRNGKAGSPDALALAKRVVASKERLLGPAELDSLPPWTTWAPCTSSEASFAWRYLFMNAVYRFVHGSSPLTIQL